MIGRYFFLIDIAVLVIILNKKIETVKKMKRKDE
jgi:hypothetical protein